MKIIAILAVYNEELYLSRCLRHLHEQGVQTYVIENGSTDRTLEIARSFLNKGMIGIEIFPRRGIYEWEPLLRRKEELAAELSADWYIHHDADEIRQAPNPYQTLAESIEAADRAGYNAVNFDEFVFIPTRTAENYEHDRYVEEMQYYYFFKPKLQHRINAWKNIGQKVDLHSSGGHEVQFEGRRIYPHNFILRHYIVLSLPHAMRKYCGKVYSEVERRDKGWHGARSLVRPDQIRFPDRSRLCKLSDDNAWDRSNPWVVHALFQNASTLPELNTPPDSETVNNKRSTLSVFRDSLVRLGYKFPCMSVIPAPFIVGNGRSGTTLLRLMLDSHPAVAIPPETHFIPKLLEDWSPSSDPRNLFLKILTEHRAWGDFHMDSEVLKSRVFKLDSFDLTQGLRSFYQLYAERFGKPRWGDKTPVYIGFMEAIQKLLPEARFIHLIRDGRDVALSYRNVWFGPQSIQEAASQWVWKIAEARRQAQNIKHYLEIRYEDLILHTTETLKRICEFIDLEWDSAMLDYHKRAGERLNELNRDVIAPTGERKVSGNERLAIHKLTKAQPEASRIGRWKTEMSDLERENFEAVARTMLRELGYEVD